MKEKNYNRFRPQARTIGNMAVITALTAISCFAQTSSVGQVIQGVATEAAAVVKWLGVIVLIVSGIAMASGGAHGGGGMAKVAGMIGGLSMAIFATPLVAWLSAL